MARESEQDRRHLIDRQLENLGWKSTPEFEK